ncbi:olfactory receptor 8G17-like [Misgurnus anguillicaudatus]|uniref:olfactory receptor 8G17-like n=1 Tax=Misgurnus anguillicaudatus TaxID=75329 RepID=UPI003CCF6F37
MDNLTLTNSLLLVEGLKVAPQSSYPVYILLLLVYIFVMGCNIILIILISTQKNLHHPMHFLFCNLPLNDILGTTVMLPRLLQDILTEASVRYITYVECVVQAYFVHIFAAASHYVLMIGLTIRLSRCRYKIENPFCDNASLFKLSCENVSVNNVFGLIYSVFIFTLSLGSVFITYIKIAIVCISSKNKALNSKAIKTCSTHIAVYLIMFVSCATMIFLHRVPEYSDSRKLASIMFHIVPPGLNPLVYGLQTKEIREKIVKLVWRKPSYLHDSTHPDWAPSLKLAGETGQTGKAERATRKGCVMGRYNRVQQRRRQASSLGRVAQEQDSPGMSTTEAYNEVNDAFETVEEDMCTSEVCSKIHADHQRLLTENISLKSQLATEKISMDTFRDDEKKVSYLGLAD